MDSLIPHKLNLSIPQIKKLLKGHAVQLSKELIGSGAGDKKIHLTPTNAKKLMRAFNNSKGMRLTLGPNEIAITGGNVIATSKDGGKSLITAGSDRAVRAIEGSGTTEARDMMISNAGRKYGGNVKKTAKKSASRLITAGTDRAIKALVGSGVNRMKKAQRWEGFTNATIRDAIDTAGKAGRVYYDTTNPMAQMGFGLADTAKNYGNSRLKTYKKRNPITSYMLGLGVRGGNITATSKDAGKSLITSGADRGVRAIEGSGYHTGYGLYGYGMQSAVMPVVGPKLGKGVATRSKVYRTAMRRNIGVDIDNASIAKPPGGRYNSAIKASSNVMTMSPYQGINSPAMHPFIPMSAYQNCGVSQNMR